MFSVIAMIWHPIQDCRGDDSMAKNFLPDPESSGCSLDSAITCSWRQPMSWMSWIKHDTIDRTGSSISLPMIRYWPLCKLKLLSSRLSGWAPEEQLITPYKLQMFLDYIHGLLCADCLALRGASISRTFLRVSRFSKSSVTAVLNSIGLRFALYREFQRPSRTTLFAYSSPSMCPQVSINIGTP